MLLIARQKDTALHLRKHTYYAFPFVLIISRIFGASSGTSYRERSPRGAVPTGGTEAFRTASCQINCRFDEGRERA